jgi:hypothetical protein
MGFQINTAMDVKEIVGHPAIEVRGQSFYIRLL